MTPRWVEAPNTSIVLSDKLLMTPMHVTSGLPARAAMHDNCFKPILRHYRFATNPKDVLPPLLRQWYTRPYPMAEEIMADAMGSFSPLGEDRSKGRRADRSSAAMQAQFWVKARPRSSRREGGRARPSKGQAPRQSRQACPLQVKASRAPSEIQQRGTVIISRARRDGRSAASAWLCI
jgi:hypothetical protein